MEAAATLEKARVEGWTDEEIVDRVRAGDIGLYELIMRRYNQRLYRVARAILRDDDEAEDVMQDTYVRAYEHLDQFALRAPFSAWLTRIAVHEALARKRHRNRADQLEEDPGYQASLNGEGRGPMRVLKPLLNPEETAATAEVRRLLEEALLSLPEAFRTVVMLRDVEQLNTAEVAAALELSDENVKVRLHRAHGMLRRWFASRIGENCKEAFPFMGERCDRVVCNVIEALRRPENQSRV